MQDGQIIRSLQGSKQWEEWTFSQETTFGKVSSKDSWKAKPQRSDMALGSLLPPGYWSQTLGSP